MSKDLGIGQCSLAKEVPEGYKQTEVGVIPQNWEVRTLGNLGEFKNGINKDKQNFGHGFPFVNLMDVFGIPSVSKKSSIGLVNSSLEEREAYELKSGDVLFVRSSVKPQGVGLTTLILEDLPNTVFSGFLIRYRDKGVLELEFKEHCFQEASFRSRLIASSTVSANTNISQESLKALELLFPPNKSEQRAIAEVLSDLDEWLSALVNLISKKQAIKQATLQQLLTGKTRLPGFSGSWKTMTLRELVEIRKGQLITSSEAILGSVPVIAGGKVPAYFHNVANRKGKTITISGSGAYAGYVAFFNQPIFASDCSTISDADHYSIEFVYFYLQMNQNTIYRCQTGGAQPHIHPSDLHPMRICVPSVVEQRAIANVLSDMDTEITVLEAHRDKTSAVKQAMMQQLLTGRIRLV